MVYRSPYLGAKYYSRLDTIHVAMVHLSPSSGVNDFGGLGTIHGGK